VIAETQQLANYVPAFSHFSNHAPGRRLSWLQRLREGAFARFCEKGFPTTRMEDWRFTNVSAIANAEFELAQNGSGLVSNAQILQHGMREAACRLVFVNGHFAPEYSFLESLPDGLVVRSLAGQIAEAPQTVEPYLGRYLNIERDAFSAFNSAFLEDGAYIHIRPGAIIEAPVYLQFVSVGNDRATMNHPRNLVVAEDGSQVAVVEDYVSLGGGTLSNAATELVAGDGTVVSHYRIERESLEAFHVSTLRIQQGRSANVASHSLLIGGGLVRNNVHPVLVGEGGECLINGLFIGKGSQHLDNYMLVEHASPHCGSRQFYNGILDDRAHGVFHGRIIVHKEAQKTDAKQTNRNLLLSDDAQIDTKPQLEILADDVKCTHNATIGKIEDQALFYLRTRGIEEPAARQMLLLAFANECTDRMKESTVRTFAQTLIESHVSQMAHMSARRRQVPSAASDEIRENSNDHSRQTSGP
jgi:Fe-S cluster assembly protein SufD